MNTKTLLLERIQEELYVRDIIREALNYTFIINENEDFTVVRKAHSSLVGGM